MIINSIEDVFGCGLLPTQYNSLVRNTRYEISEGERCLFQAVLEDAIHIYLSHRNARTRSGRLRFLETRQWFEQRGDYRARGLFAFESLCEVLGLEPELLRVRLGVRQPTHKSTVPVAIGMRTTRNPRARR